MAGCDGGGDEDGSSPGTSASGGAACTIKSQSAPATCSFMYDPAGHSVQKAWPSCQLCEPAGQRLRTLPSGHAEPIGQMVQLPLKLLVRPRAYCPDWHGWCSGLTIPSDGQNSFNSGSQAVQLGCPGCAWKEPIGHACGDPEPSAQP